MSSGNFDSIWRQEASVKKMLLDGKGSLKNYQRGLQAVIAGDDIVVVPKITTATDGGKIFHVTGNFGSTAEAIHAGGYASKLGLAKTPNKIPLVIQPVDCRVRFAQPHNAFRIEEIFELYPKIVDPMTLFTFGALFPKGHPCQKSILTVWKYHGQFWGAILSRDGSGRTLHVGPRDTGRDWVDGRYNVLVHE